MIWRKESLEIGQKRTSRFFDCIKNLLDEPNDGLRE